MHALRVVGGDLQQRGEDESQGAAADGAHQGDDEVQARDEDGQHAWRKNGRGTRHQRCHLPEGREAPPRVKASKTPPRHATG